MRAGNLVGRTQRAAHPRRNAFLADAGVHRAVDAVLPFESEQRFLEAADEDDLLQQPEQLLGELRFPIGVLDDELAQRRGDGETFLVHAFRYTAL